MSSERLRHIRCAVEMAPNLARHAQRRRGAHHTRGGMARLGMSVMVAVALLLLGPGAGSASRLGGSPAPHAVLVIIGDSLSTGYSANGDQAARSWPAVLVRQHPQLGRLVNLATDGWGFNNEETYQGKLPVFSQTKQALAAHPTVIIIWLGSNDFSMRSVPDIAHDLDVMLGYLTATHARAFVINYPTLKDWGDGPDGNRTDNADVLAFNHALPPVLARHHASLIDMHAATRTIWGDPSNTQQDNPPHPTAKGSVAIAQVVSATLHRDGVL